jgi:hypothetical protein
VDRTHTRQDVDVARPAPIRAHDRGPELSGVVVERPTADDRDPRVRRLGRDRRDGVARRAPVRPARRRGAAAGGAAVAVYVSHPDRSHVSHVVCDSGWEAHLAGKLEHIPAVRSYVKNQGLGFTIPYTIDGQRRSYVPDFIARLDDGRDEGGSRT